MFNILEFMLARVVKLDVKAITQVVANRPRYCDPARRCHPLKPSRHIYPVAEDVVGLDYYVANMDSNAQANRAVLGEVGNARQHPTLDVSGGCNGVNYARELRQPTVAGRLEHAAFMFGDLGIDDLGPDSLQCNESPGLVFAH
jgi:hypothetical protein